MSEPEIRRIIKELNIDEGFISQINVNKRSEAINMITQMYNDGEIKTESDAMNVLTEKSYFEQMTSTMADNEFTTAHAGVIGAAGGAVSQVIGNSQQLKFDPVKLLEASEKLRNYQKRYMQSIAAIKRKAENLLGSWQGDSSALYIDKIKELDSQSIKEADVLLMLADDLATASGIYKTGEADAKKKAESLPTDGVFLV